MSLNRVEISGTLTRDPELRYTASGAAVSDFTVVVNGTRYDRGKREQVVTSDFIACQVWGQPAERFAENGEKGDEVLVLGQLDQSRYERKDGTTVDKTRVTAMAITFLRSRKWEQPEPVPAREEPF